jgi:hypothetical protein
MNSSFAIAPRLPRGKAAFARERICNNLSIFRREGTQEKHLLWEEYERIKEWRHFLISELGKSCCMGRWGWWWYKKKVTWRIGIIFSH